MAKPKLLRALARSILSGEINAQQIELRCVRTLGREWPWITALAVRIADRFSRLGPHPRLREVEAFLRNDPEFQTLRHKHRREMAVHDWLADPPRMRPVPVATAWRVPTIETVGELADFLGVSVGELEWFADPKELTNRNNEPRLANYVYRVLRKPSGGVRIIEMPKPRLKRLQRRILDEILANVPAHNCAHGFVRGRSTKSFATPHVSRAVVLKMDLQDFFPSFRAARIAALFRTMGYPEQVADLLTGICTNAVPRKFWSTLDLSYDQRRDLVDSYCRPHLPQGAPTSPALANLCSYRIDCRLAGLAKSSGATYTRYADDLAFSGGEGFPRSASNFSLHAAAVLMEEGFSVAHRKTRIMRSGVRQHLAGLVVNQRLNMKRSEFDRLKAILTNCVRLGPESQNREALPSFREHLEGKVGYVESIHPARGRKLRELYEKVSWET